MSVFGLRKRTLAALLTNLYLIPQTSILRSGSAKEQSLSLESTYTITLREQRSHALDALIR